MTKIIAFHLPQFHQIPENDEWWGKGFTEWTNVKKGKPLFNGHRQPRKPLDNYYYDLTDPQTKIWQAELAKEYGIYGFCYYHYWFNGKKLLEKPVEQLLESAKPDLPFCLAWANEPWTRAWDGRKSQVLMPQSYGGENEWKRHFEYLLPFFKDTRYICQEDKPVFILYRTSSIIHCDDMLKFWETLAKEEGLPGIFFIEMLNSFQDKSHSNQTKGIIEFEPLYTLAYDFNLFERFKRKSSALLRKDRLNRIDYDKLWQKILSRKLKDFGKKIYPGAFVDWDNSPRRSENALMMMNNSPKKFQSYLSQQLERSQREYRSDLLFINAWNEWAEGAYLEPDEDNNFAYLGAIKEALKVIKKR